jgi:hypothetical protein
VLARIRQALLDDAVGRAPDRLRNAVRPRRLVAPADVHARVPGLFDERGNLRQRGLRPVLVDLLAEQANHAPQLLERRLGRAADDARGLRDLIRRSIGPKLERSGVHAEQREAMREDVVHLARNAPALGLAGLLDTELLLGFETLGPFAQGIDQLPPGTREQPPADRDRQDQEPEGELLGPRALRGVEQQRGRNRHNRQRHHAEEGAPRRADGDVVDGDRSGTAGHRREGCDGHGGDRDLDRTGTADPERKTHGDSGNDVDDDHRVAVVLPCRVEACHADSQRRQNEEHVYDPVPCRTAPVLLLDELGGQQAALPSRHARGL